MKIAISASGDNLNAEINQRFGRTRWLIIYDLEKDEYEAINNSDNYNAPQGAGIKTADLIVKKNCKAVITGHLGPKAFNVLKTNDIKGYTCQSGNILEVIQKFKSNELNQITSPDVQGHW